MAKRASKLRWTVDPAMKLSGHSRANMPSPMRRLMIWRIGTGLTAGSNVFVRKSQNTFGQKKPSRAAAI